MGEFMNIDQERNGFGIPGGSSSYDSPAIL